MPQRLVSRLPTRQWRHSSTKTHPKPFFARVNEQMQQDSPHKYEQFEKGRRQAIDKIKKSWEDERNNHTERWWVRSTKERTNDPESFFGDSKSLSYSFQPPNTTASPKTSIFSTIQSTIQSSNNGDISSLFAPPTPPPMIPRNKAMIYNPDHYETYQEVMTVVLEGNNTQNYFKKLSKDGTVKLQIFDAVKKWLLSDERVIEKDIVEQRWREFDQVWRRGWKEGASTIFEGGAQDDAEHASKLDRELTIQRELFMNKLLEDNPTLLSLFTNDDSMDQEEAKQNLSEEFHEVATLLITYLLRHCAKRSRSDPMHICWYKVKESGMKLPQDSISTFLYVVATMGSGFSTFKSARSWEEEEENPYLVPEEVATFHDLLCRPTESSVSLRIKTLAGKGDTETAEELLEAYKVRPFTDWLV
jgi:hypothetical protein